MGWDTTAWGVDWLGTACIMLVTLASCPQ